MTWLHRRAVWSTFQTSCNFICKYLSLYLWKWSDHWHKTTSYYRYKWWQFLNIRLLSLTDFLSLIKKKNIKISLFESESIHCIRIYVSSIVYYCGLPPLLFKSLCMCLFSVSLSKWLVTHKLQLGNRRACSFLKLPAPLPASQTPHKQLQDQLSSSSPASLPHTPC